MFSSDYEVTVTGFESLMASFFKLADVRLSSTQKQVLSLSNNLLRVREVSMTALADLVSRRSNVPYSTVKWNLRSLKEMGLLTGGDSASKGKPAQLTEEAQMLADYFEKQA